MTKEDEVTARARERAALGALLESMARADAPEALTEAVQLYDEAKEEHTRQCAGYDLHCTRHGMFLTLTISRLGNPVVSEHSEWKSPEQLFATSLNLSQCIDIRLVVGNEPDYRGVLYYSYNLPNNIYRKTPCVPRARPLLVIGDQPYDMGMGYYDYNMYRIQHKIENYPRVAVDDMIIFSGLNAILYVPAGLGAESLRRILTVT